MARICIEDLPRHAGETVTIRGWLYHKRSSGKIRFLVVATGQADDAVLGRLSAGPPEGGGGSVP